MVTWFCGGKEPKQAKLLHAKPAGKGAYAAKAVAWRREQRNLRLLRVGFISALRITIRGNVGEKEVWQEFAYNFIDDAIENDRELDGTLAMHFVIAAANKSHFFLETTEEVVILFARRFLFATRR